MTARTALKVAAEVVDLPRRSRRGATILIYHRVGARSGIQVDLPTDLFDRQMAELATSGRVVTLDEALSLLARPEPPELDPVVVTFDDGTDDFATTALPVLVRHRVPATLYVATAFVEEQRSFPDDGRPLTWEAVRDCVATGLVTVGSHTHTHALLDRLRPDLVDDELRRSIDLIGERAGCEAHHFAYPKALPGSPDAETAVRASFRSAALAGTRTNAFGATDVHRLARSPIQVADGMRWFRRKVEGGMGLEDTVRRVANRRRYAEASN